MRTAALLVLLAAPAAQEEPTVRRVADLRLTLDDHWPTPESHFPFPVRVRIENLGPPRTVELKVAGLGFGTAAHWEVSRRLSVGTAEKARVSLPVPFTEDYMRLTVRVDGREARELSADFAHRSRHDGPQHLLIDRVGGIAPEVLRSAFPGGRLDSSYGAVPADRLCDQWQSYAGLAGIWARAREWKSAEPAAREAILRAVRAGQTLVLYETQGEPLAELLFPSGSSATAPEISSGGDAEHAAFGLGRIATAPEDILERPDLPARFQVPKPFEKQMGKTLGFKGVGEVPYAGFFWIVLVFAILIGPGNILAVLWLRRRLLFVVTTPLAALLGMGALFLYSAFSEGFGLKAVTWSETWIDREHKEAVVLARHGYYSGTSSGLWRYRPDTLCVLTGLPRPDPYSFRKASGRVITADWSREQELGGGWVPPARSAPSLPSRPSPFGDAWSSSGRAKERCGSTTVWGRPSPGGGS